MFMWQRSHVGSAVNELADVEAEETLNDPAPPISDVERLGFSDDAELECVEVMHPWSRESRSR